MKPIRLIAIAFAALLTFFLPACQGAHRTDISPARPVISRPVPDVAYDASNLEIAVGKDGSHHMIYMEEEERGFHRLVYAYQKFAGTPRLLVIPPETGADAYLNPDIAVTSDGRVHIVWQLRSSSSHHLYNCYASFLPTEITPPTCNNLDAGGAGGYGYALDNEPPVLVSENTKAYAVYSVLTRDAVIHHRLKAQLLSPTVDGTPETLHDVVHSVNVVQYHRPALAIEDDGMLHAVITLTNTTNFNTDSAYYSRSDTNGGGDSEFLASLMTTHQFMDSTLLLQHATQEADQVYFLLASNPHGAVGRSFLYFYSLKSDEYGGDFPAPVEPLPEASNFVVRGSPSMVFENDVPRAYFAATSNAGENEVYSGRVDLADSVFSILKETPFTDCAPRAVIANQPNPNDPPNPYSSPVVIWRDCSGGAVRDMYVYDTTSSETIWRLRKVADQAGSNVKTDYELAVYGDDLFAAWIDVRSESDPRLVPWISTNTNRVMLPAIQK